MNDSLIALPSLVRLIVYKLCWKLDNVCLVSQVFGCVLRLNRLFQVVYKLEEVC